MYKTGLGSLVVALVLLWGGSAMAQVKCEGHEGFEPILTYPAYTGRLNQEMFSIINTTGDPVPFADLCFVGGDRTIPPRDGQVRHGIMSYPVSRYFRDAQLITVFTNNENFKTSPPLRGAGITGRQNGPIMAYEAFYGDEAKGSEKVEIALIPGSFWRAVGIFNNDDADQTVTITVTDSRGEVYTENESLRPLRTTFLQDSWFERKGIPLDRDLNITIEAAADKKIFAFALFSKDSSFRGEGSGLMGVPIED